MEEHGYIGKQKSGYAQVMSHTVIHNIQTKKYGQQPKKPHDCASQQTRRPKGGINIAYRA